MKLRDAALATLPEEVGERIVGLVEEMYESIVDGELSAAEAEERVAQLSREVGQQVLSAGFFHRYGKQTGSRRSCRCGGQQRFEGYRERWVITLVGPVRYRRGYYRCQQCGASYYAGDEQLGLEGSLSLPAQEAVSLACCELPFERAVALLERISAVQISTAQARKLSEAHGQRLEVELIRQREGLFAGKLEYLLQEWIDRLYISLDGTQAPFVDDWHEAKLGAVYEGKPDEEGNDRPGETTYQVGVREPPDAFGRRLYQEAARRGVEQAAETVAIGDGAPWIWNLVEEHFPDAVQILDFYHAVERLYEVGRALYGDGSTQAQQWAEANKERLWRGEVRAMMQSLRGLRPSTEQGQEAVRLAIGYFATNLERMRYPQYRANGYHIGSGVVEAGCKNVVGARCKRSGMRWTKQGAQAILALRCLLLNGRWNEYWRPLKTAA